MKYYAQYSQTDRSGKITTGFYPVEAEDDEKAWRRGQYFVQLGTWWDHVQTLEYVTCQDGTRVPTQLSLIRPPII